MRTLKFGLILSLMACMSCFGEDIPAKQTITLGVVQGITEFLPVSSTGHMILVNEVGFHSKEQSQRVQSALDNYMVCIQLGTILTLLLFYRRDVIRIFRGCLGRDRDGFNLGWNLGIAFIPAGVIGFLCDNIIQQYFYGKMCVVLALILGGFVILWLENFRAKHRPMITDIYDVSMKSAWIVGMFQVIALWPGFSRSLATIMGCLCVGMCLKSAIHFSFLLGLLTSSVATLYKFLKHGTEIFETMEGLAALGGVLVAFLVGMSTIHIFLWYLRTHGLKIFGYYRILIGVILSIC